MRESGQNPDKSGQGQRKQSIGCSPMSKYGLIDWKYAPIAAHQRNPDKSGQAIPGDPHCQIIANANQNVDRPLATNGSVSRTKQSDTVTIKTNLTPRHCVIY